MPDEQNKTQDETEAPEVIAHSADDEESPIIGCTNHEGGCLSN